MKVIIKTDRIDMSANMTPEDAEALVAQAMKYSTRYNAKLRETSTPTAAPPEEKKAPQSRAESMFGPKDKWSMPAAAAPKPEPSADSTAGDWQTEGPRGFFHIKCDGCGEVKSFYTKNRIKYHSCKCGHSTELSNLLPAYMNCKCGVVNARYRTNLRDAYITPNCFICGAPVDMELNVKKMVYVTIKE